MLKVEISALCHQDIIITDDLKIRVSEDILPQVIRNLA
jgi:hypothetical protein